MKPEIFQNKSSRFHSYRILFISIVSFLVLLFEIVIFVIVLLPPTWSILGILLLIAFTYWMEYRWLFMPFSIVVNNKIITTYNILGKRSMLLTEVSSIRDYKIYLGSDVSGLIYSGLELANNKGKIIRLIPPNFISKKQRNSFHKQLQSILRTTNTSVKKLPSSLTYTEPFDRAG